MARIRCEVTAQFISAFDFITQCTSSSSQVRNLKPLVIFSGCTARFESELVGNFQDRFLMTRLDRIMLKADSAHVVLGMNINS